MLWFEFARPLEVDPGSPQDIAVQLTEGWILGSSPTVQPQHAHPSIDDLPEAAMVKAKNVKSSDTAT